MAHRQLGLSFREAWAQPILGVGRYRLLRAVERHGSINAAASTRRFSGVDWNGMAAAISNIKMAALIGM